MLLKSVFDFELVFLNKQNWAILILILGLVALQSINGSCETIERIGSGCASNLVRVLIRLTAPVVLL